MPIARLKELTLDLNRILTEYVRLEDSSSRAVRPGVVLFGRTAPESELRDRLGVQEGLLAKLEAQSSVLRGLADDVLRLGRPAATRLYGGLVDYNRALQGALLKLGVVYTGLLQRTAGGSYSRVQHLRNLLEYGRSVGRYLALGKELNLAIDLFLLDTA